KLMTGFEGFRVSELFEIKCFDHKLSKEVGESGLILEANWDVACEWFRRLFKENPHYDTCMALIKQFDFSNPEKKFLLEWREYCREINIEDAIKPDSDTIVVSTMHKSKGKEYDHVIMIVEDYNYSNDESRRLLYVASSRAKKTLDIHTNIDFYDTIESKNLTRTEFKGTLNEPHEYEMILSHKDIYLDSQKYWKALSLLKSIKTGDHLEECFVPFGNNVAPGLGIQAEGTLLLYSKNFTEKVYNPRIKDGYKITDAKAEYIVFWYDKDEGKVYKIVLPWVKFKKGVN